MSRRPLVAGNWKMFKTRAEARAFAETLAANLAQADGVELAICPPFTSIDVVATILQGTGVGVFGQTGHESENGAHTGEISMGM